MPLRSAIDRWRRNANIAAAAAQWRGSIFKTRPRFRLSHCAVRKRSRHMPVQLQTNWRSLQVFLRRPVNVNFGINSFAFFSLSCRKNTPLQLNLNKRAQASGTQQRRAQASGTQQRHLNVWEDAQSARLHFSIFISRHSSTCQRRTEEHSNVILPVNCFQTPALERIKCASVSLGKVLANQAGSFLGMKWPGERVLSAT